ncbi:MAG TPA: TaqI-like C-terminal specificity domain-containing protein, partial [Candidatus Goldiibacteriota bacterium]|nr:TaqI-like C-terminal specificity domain-containing protein [Candidatus Goldiibacteriota bacterium]
LEHWREMLAKNLFKNNKKLFDGEDREKSADFLKEVTQKILDRIIFIRFCEDRKLTQSQRVIDRLAGKDDLELKTYEKILEPIFREYEGIFNSDLFAKRDWEKDLQADYKVVNAIVSETCEPYMFDVIPIEVLGNIYEQYLGHTIRLTPENVKYEEKPEVRKAGGVYYTPEYIVDYIVKNTVGKLLSELPEAKAKKIRILDPACGSGSFLIRAYEEMLKYYEGLKGKSKQKVSEGQTAMDTGSVGAKLTLEEKAGILKEHIFGVDIDDQAVEVTKLSLMLKMLEGEWGLVKGTHLLPMLDKNIRCGNSLVSGNVLELNKYFGEDFHKVKPFNWEEEFESIMVDEGGFDVVIGNPPYVNVENLEKRIREYYFEFYKTCSGRTDIYVAFIEKALKLFRQKGYISFIVPYAFTNQNYGYLLRKELTNKYYIDELLDTSEYFVFDNAVVKNIIIRLQNISNQHKTLIKKIKSRDEFKENKFHSFEIDQNEFLRLKENRFETKNIYSLSGIKDKIWLNSIPLEKICFVAYGARLNHKTKKIGKENYIHKEKKKGLKPFLEGKDIERYAHAESGWLNYEPREHYNPMFKELFENEKIMSINVVKDRLRFTIDSDYLYNSHTVINCIRYDKLVGASHSSAVLALKTADLNLCKKYNTKYILGILNSKLINWYFVNFLSESLHFYPNDAKGLPIRAVDEKTAIRISEEVELMISLQKKSKNSKGSELEQIRTQIVKTDEEIDDLVYELYGITEEERKIIEE